VFVNFHKALIAGGGDKAAAVTAYKALMDNPTVAGAAPETFVRAAQSYAAMLAAGGDKDKALAVLDRAEEIFGERVQVTALRRDIEAGKTPVPLVSTPADGASEVLLDLGSALNRGGGEAFVRLYLRMALALRPDSDAALMQLASVSEQMRNPQEAIELYKLVPANSPIHKVAELQLGLNLADLGEEAEAVTRLKSALADDQDDTRAYLSLGGVYQSQKNFQAAADVYDAAIARIGTPTRNDWNVFYQRGIAFERLKQWDKAEKDFLKALEFYPDQPQVMNYLGYSWVDMNIKLEEGLALIKKAVDLRPSDGYIVDSLGWAYYRLGRYDDAVREMERAVSLKPEDPVLNDHLGDAYWRVGRKLEATFQWNHARDMKPDPDVLASVQQKLLNGLPPLEDKATAQEIQKPKPEPVPAPKG
jgi:tetratricopeptide (TPR) repeat protein